jgi:hypothetical protein
MSSTFISLGSGIHIKRTRDAENVGFILTVPTGVGDKPSELSRKLRQAFALADFPVPAGIYEVTIRRTVRK